MTIFVLKALGFLLLLYLAQDIFIFPGAFFSLVKKILRLKPPLLPPGAKSAFVLTKDKKSLEVWEFDASGEVKREKTVAIIFHGNGGTLENFFFAQLWLSDLGIKSYCFDYRGFGRSSGWPTENGIMEDARTVYDYVISKENISSDHLLFMGISVGGAPAAAIAAEKSPRVLLLLSSFFDLTTAVKDQKLLGLFAPLLRYTLSTGKSVQKLTRTSLLLAHAEDDQVIPIHHMEQLAQSYVGNAEVLCVRAKKGGHNLALYELQLELGKELEKALGWELQ